MVKMFKSLLKLVTPAFSYTSASRKSQFIGHYMPHSGAVPCSAEKAMHSPTDERINGPRDDAAGQWEIIIISLENDKSSSPLL